MRGRPTTIMKDRRRARPAEPGSGTLMGPTAGSGSHSRGQRAASLLSREQELAVCADLISQFAGVLQSPRTTPVPTAFDSLWDQLRGAVDGEGDVARAIDLLRRMPSNSAD